jgi:hypothetical protein
LLYFFHIAAKRAIGDVRRSDLLPFAHKERLPIILRVFCLCVPPNIYFAREVM